MAELVRVGIVGTSFWADFMYLPSLQSHPQAQIAAICGRNADRAGGMAQKYPRSGAGSNKPANVTQNSSRSSSNAGNLRRTVSRHSCPRSLALCSCSRAIRRAEVR
jgi:hypothetical protein